MQVPAEHIEGSLQTRIYPVYLVCGDEPLQHAESLDAIRAACKAAGYTNREVFDVEAGFNWGAFEIAARSLSLFAEKRLLDLRFSTGLPDKAADIRLVEYLERVPADTVLLVSCGKLAKTTAKSAWFRALDRSGGIVQVWPLKRNRFLPWLDTRARCRGLVMDQAALRLLASRVEGNLLAAAQEVDKLFVVYGSAALNVDQVREAVVDSAHYDVFDLVDSALAGDGARCYRILSSMRAEGLAPQIVLWALARELRMLSGMRYDLERGIDRSTLYKQHRIWENRKALIDSALRRLGLSQLQAYARRCAGIDLAGKGLSARGVWEDLLLLSLALAGNSPLDEIAFDVGDSAESGL